MREIPFLLPTHIVAANQPRPGPILASGRSEGSEAKKNQTALGNAGRGIVGSPKGAFQKPKPAVPLSLIVSTENFALTES